MPSMPATPCRSQEAQGEPEARQEGEPEPWPEEEEEEEERELPQEAEAERERASLMSVLRPPRRTPMLSLESRPLRSCCSRRRTPRGGPQSARKG